MHLELKEVIEDKGDEDIGNKADSYYQKVFELTAYEQDKQKKKYD